jgi:preprotein translocase subunit SecE
MWGFESLLPCQQIERGLRVRAVLAARDNNVQPGLGLWGTEVMASAERLKLKNQEMAGGDSESRGGAFWERVKAYPERWRGFLHEVRVEMRQVTWPTRHDVIVTTFVVIVAVAFFAVFFFGVDSTVSYVLQRVFALFKH